MLESFLSKCSWYIGLQESEKQQILNDMLVTTYPAGSFVIRKGDPSRYWIGIVEGLIRISVGSADGKLASLIGAFTGSWIGEGSILKQEQYKYDLVTLRTTTIARLPADSFNWLLNNSLPFNHFLLGQLNDRLSQFIGRTESARLLTADGRVARCIAELVQQPNSLNPEIKSITITQEEIGYLAGVSRQRTNAALKKLTQQGLIDSAYGTITIHNLSALMNYEQ